MVAVRLARAWIGYDGTVHRPGELVDVDAVTLAKMEASGVVSEGMGTSAESAGPTDDEEATQAWAGPTSDDEADSEAWAGPTSDDEADSDAAAGEDRA